jgi:hypothetical protein
MYFDEKGRNMDKRAVLADLQPMASGYSGSITIVLTRADTFSITSCGCSLHPGAAPPGRRYALPWEYFAGAHRISCLTLILRTVPAKCIGLG